MADAGLIAGDAGADVVDARRPWPSPACRVADHGAGHAAGIGLALAMIASAICGWLMRPVTMTGIATAAFTAAAKGAR